MENLSNIINTKTVNPSSFAFNLYFDTNNTKKNELDNSDSNVSNELTKSVFKSWLKKKTQGWVDRFSPDNNQKQEKLDEYHKFLSKTYDKSKNHYDSMNSLKKKNPLKTLHAQAGILYHIANEALSSIDPDEYANGIDPNDNRIKTFQTAFQQAQHMNNALSGFTIDKKKNNKGLKPKNKIRMKASVENKWQERYTTENRLFNL